MEEKILILENEKLKISIEEKGAELTSLISKDLKKDFIWNGNPTYWGRHAPILFPIVGRLKNDVFKIDGNEFKMPKHGFARDSLFRLFKKGKKSALFVLKESKDTLLRYPFKFTLFIFYFLYKNCVKIKLKVYSKEEKLPFSIGFHPAFFCPFNENEELSEYAIFFEKGEKCKRLFLKNDLIQREEDFVLKKKQFDLNEEIFASDAIILKNPKSNWVILSRKDFSGGKIKVSFKGFSYLAFWKKPFARFICIEPCMGINDYEDFEGSFFEKDGIVLLKKSESFEKEVVVTLI